jgi:hypothetical protein
VKIPSFQINNRNRVKVSLRCVGIDEEFIICFVFDEVQHVLLTLWSLSGHQEILLMRSIWFVPDASSLSLVDLSIKNHDICYLATTTGDLHVFDIFKLKGNNKVQNLSSDDAVQQFQILLGEDLDRLMCLNDDRLVISTTASINIFDRTDLSHALRTIPIGNALHSWSIIEFEAYKQLLITVDSEQQFISIYQLAENQLQSTNEMTIEFRSYVTSINLFKTKTMMDNDDNAKVYVLISLFDMTIQLFDTNQLSQASLKPTGLFSKVKNVDVCIHLIIVLHLHKCMRTYTSNLHLSITILFRLAINV